MRPGSAEEKVVDLMAALEASLARAKESTPKCPVCGMRAPTTKDGRFIAHRDGYRHHCPNSGAEAAGRQSSGAIPRSEAQERGTDVR